MSTIDVVLASRNSHKAMEITRILNLDGLNLLPVGPDVPDVPETGATFIENALIKARSVCEATGQPALADDSGIAIDALAGMPGIFSARWAGVHGDDAANLNLVLAQLADVPDERRGAQFVCAIALVTPDGRETTVEGIVHGRVIREPRGAYGFGYDPIFVPEGYDRTTAELSPSEKDAISHRARALALISPAISDLMAH